MNSEYLGKTFSFSIFSEKKKEKIINSLISEKKRRIFNGGG